MGEDITTCSIKTDERIKYMLYDSQSIEYSTEVLKQLDSKLYLQDHDHISISSESS